MPFTFWADYAQNIASDVEDETAYGVGVTLGKASNAKTWEAGLFYQSIDKDALFAQMIDSDFGDGVTDAEGWVLKAGYAPVKNVTLNGTYFMNTLYRLRHRQRAEQPAVRWQHPGVRTRLQPAAARRELQVLIALLVRPSPGLPATLSRLAGEGRVRATPPSP